MHVHMNQQTSVNLKKATEKNVSFFKVPLKCCRIASCLRWEKECPPQPLPKISVAHETRCWLGYKFKSLLTQRLSQGGQSHPYLPPRTIEMKQSTSQLEMCHRNSITMTRGLQSCHWIRTGSNFQSFADCFLYINARWIQMLGSHITAI